MIKHSSTPPSIVSTDIIAAVLYYSYLNHFRGDLKLIHETVFELRKDSNLLKSFPFSQNDVYPFSRQLEDALFSLERSRIIGMENPDFEMFIIKEKGKTYIQEKIIPRFNRGQLDELENLGKKFSSKCAPKNDMK